MQVERRIKSISRFVDVNLSDIFCAYGSWICFFEIFPEPSLQVTEFVGKPLQTRLVYDIETTLQADNDIDPFNASHFSFTSCSSHNFMDVPFTSSQPSKNIFPHSKKDIFVQRWCCTACKRGGSMVLHTTSPATSATSEFTSPASKYDTGLDLNFLHPDIWEQSYFWGWMLVEVYMEFFGIILVCLFNFFEVYLISGIDDSSEVLDQFAEPGRNKNKIHGPSIDIYWLNQFTLKFFNGKTSGRRCLFFVCFFFREAEDDICI